MTDIEIEDLIRKAKCCGKPKFVDELPETVVEGKFIVFEDTLYVGHEGVWVALGVNGEGITDTLAFWNGVNSLDSVSINTGITLNEGVINSNYREKRVTQILIAAVTPTWWGTSGGTIASSTQLGNITFTNKHTLSHRVILTPISATANAAFGSRAVQNSFFRGSNSISGLGGFKFFAKAGTEVWTNGCRFFVGFADSDNVVTANPSSLDNTVGFCVDDTDAGQIYFLTRGTSATKQPTGMYLSNLESFEFYIDCESDSSAYNWAIISTNTGATNSGVATTNLPIEDYLLAPKVMGSSAETASTSTISISISKVYIESE